MSTIQTQLNIVHLDSAIALGTAVQRVSVESTFGASAIEVLTSNEAISTGDVGRAKQFMIKLISGDDVMISLDGSTYPFRLADVGEATLLRLNVEGDSGDREAQTVTTVADSSGSLDGTYFVVEDASGNTWAIGFGTLSHSEDFEISVTIATNDTAATVAAAVAAALQADTAFSALFTVEYDAGVDDDFITITDNFDGTRTNIADTGSTGFTVATTNAGTGSATTVYLKSEGISQVAVVVAPV